MRKTRNIIFNHISALSGSAKINRVLQTKSTVVAFGSSTPTARIPPTILKTATPAQTGSAATPSGSVVKKIPSPKAKYNLRTRLFANPTSYNEKNDAGSDEVSETLT